MILLQKDKYHKVVEPLKNVSINNFFARSVIEKKVDGSAYVDNVVSPKTFYVVHPYGMSLLFGDNRNKEFNSQFLEYSLNKNKIRDRHEWMQAFPQHWDNTLLKLFNGQLIKSKDNMNEKGVGKVELNTRVNFKFQPEIYKSTLLNMFDEGIEIVRTDKKLFSNMPGSVVPKYFWNDADHFINNGVGFSLLYKNKLASTAYSAFIHADQLELGIETVEEFRGRGFARHACSALIDYCLQNHFEPIWSCRLENVASYQLAQKLGFKPTFKIPYYRLCD